MDEGIGREQWVLAGAGVLLIVAAVVVGLRDVERAPAAAAASAPHTSLRTQHDGVKWTLHWNAQSPDVRSAKAGAVVIQDGARESRMELTPRDLRAGMASYWPDSRDVAFRLELDGAVAGVVQASAEVQEKRPSPFASTEAPRRRGVPIKRVAARTPVYYEAAERKPSGLKKVVRKIPLLGRLAGRDK